MPTVSDFFDQLQALNDRLDSLHNRLDGANTILDQRGATEAHLAVHKDGNTDPVPEHTVERRGGSMPGSPP